MADSVLRLKIDSQEYDAKLKQARQGLQALEQSLQASGKSFDKVDKSVIDYVSGIGKMETVSRSAKGRIGEMSTAFVELSQQYNRMSSEMKQTDFGKALSQSLEELRQRTVAAKQELAGLNARLGETKMPDTGKATGGLEQMKGMLDQVGHRMGLNANLTEVLTSRTAMMTAGIGAAVAVIGKATQEWSKYNSELSKQDQITTVTTGVKGPEANRMTDQARALVDTYNVDFRETINAANILMTQFGKTGEEAMQLIRDGMQGMLQGDGPKLLQMIQQYAPSFRDAGIEASQLVAIIQNSEGGIFTDQNMNAIVMGIKNIRLMTKATGEALAKLGVDGADMTRRLNDGTLTIFQAMQKVTDAINGAGSSSQAVGEVMQQVFGRQGAAAGTKLGEAIAQLNTNLEEMKRQTGEVGDAYNDLYDANVRLNSAIREAFGYDGWEQMATGIRTKLITALAEVVGWLGTIRQWFNNFTPGGQTANTESAEQKDMNRRLAYVRQGSNKQYWNQQNRQYYDEQVNERKFKVAALSGNDAITKGLRQKAEADLQAWKNLRDEYQQKADKILNQPVTTVDTNKAKPIETDTSKKTTTSTKHVKTEEQQNNEAIQRLTQEYVKATDTRRAAIRSEIKDLQNRNKELKRLAEEAQGANFSNGSLPMLTRQLKELQQQQQQSADGSEWDEYGKKIQAVSDKIKVMKGELPKNQQAEFKMTVNADELDQLRAKMPQDTTIHIDVEEGTVNLPKVPTEDETIRVNVEQGKVDLPQVPAEDKTIHVNVEQGKVDLPQVPAEDKTIHVNVEEGTVNLPKVPTDDETIKVNVEAGTVNLPQVPAEDKTIRVNVEQGKVDLPQVPAEDKTIHVNVEEGKVNLPKVPTDDETIHINVEPGTVNLPEIPIEDKTYTITVTATTAEAAQEFSGLVGNMENTDVKITPKVEIDEQDLRTPFERLQDSIRLEIAAKNIDIDQNALRSLAEVVTRYDIKPGNIDMDAVLQQTEALTAGGMEAGKAYAKALQEAIGQNIDLATIQQRIGEGFDIPDSTWQALQDEINTKLKEMGIEPIKLDFETGSVKKQSKEMSKDWNAAATAIQSVGSAMSAIEDPAAKVVGTIAQAIASVALAASQAMAAKDTTASGWAWIGAAAAITGTMISTIAAIHSATGYAEGGMIKGNSYSMDNLMAQAPDGGLIGLNAGEVVLNAAQQQSLASNLQNQSGGSQRIVGVLKGEDIVLMADRWGMRTGRGELLFAKNL